MLPWMFESSDLEVRVSVIYRVVSKAFLADMFVMKTQLNVWFFSCLIVTSEC